MTGDWQDVVAVLAALAAAAYLARAFLPRLTGRPAGGCSVSGCGGCPLSGGRAAGSGCGRPGPDPGTFVAPPDARAGTKG